MRKQFGKTRWRGFSLYLDYYVNGKRKRLKFGTVRNNTRKEKNLLENDARRALNQIELDLRSGKFFDNQNKFPTFQQMALFYWDKKHSQKPYIKNDARNRSSDWSKIKLVIDSLGSLPANELNLEQLKKFRRSLIIENNKRKEDIGKSKKKPWKNVYINKFIAIIGQVFNFCINQEIWDYSTASAKERLKYGNINLCENLPNPRHNLRDLPEEKFNGMAISHDEFISLLNYLPSHIQPMAFLAASTGLRRQNIRFLRWDQVDLDRGIITISANEHKGKTEQIIKTLHIEAIELLKRLPKDNLYVFHNSEGMPWEDFYKSWRKACSMAGITGFRFHDLKVSYASWLAEAGLPVEIIRKALGHSNNNMTIHYIQNKNASKLALKYQKPLLRKIA